jgi:hypothetical protein
MPAMTGRSAIPDTLELFPGLDFGRGPSNGGAARPIGRHRNRRAQPALRPPPAIHWSLSKQQAEKDSYTGFAAKFVRELGFVGLKLICEDGCDLTKAQIIERSIIRLFLPSRYLERRLPRWTSMPRSPPHRLV